MPTYLIDGVKYKSDLPLSVSDLEELSSSVEGDDSSGKEEDKEPSYLAESARKGAARFVSPIYGALKGAITGTGQTGAKEYTEEARRGIVGMLGGTGAKPKTQGQQILGAGVEALADPTSYIMPGGSLATKSSPMFVPLAKGIESIFSGMGAEAGGIFGGKTGEMIGGETGEKIGRVGGALIGGATGNTVAGTLPRTAALVGPAVSKVKGIISKIRGNETLEAAEQLASKHVDNIFLAAAKADPKFVDVFEEALKAQERTGIKMPLSSMMKDNAVINAYIGHLANKDQAFREAFSRQFDSVKTGLGKKATTLFGNVEDADKFIAKSLATKTDDLAAQAKTVGRKVSSIDSQSYKLAAELDQVNPFEFGSKVIKSVENAEDAARATVAPAYRKAFDIAKEKGVTLKSDSVDDIYNTVVKGENADIFSTFPSIYAKVKQRFAPKTEEASKLVDEFGMPLSADKRVFSAASVDDLDSLKREINLQLRGARTDSHIRVLQNLKDKVNQHIDILDPDFVSAYRNADKSYLMKVGLPFNEETIKTIERAKFNENIIPLLTKNKSTVSQFIETTGSQGKQLVEDAFVSEMSKFVKNGVIDAPKAKAWLSTKRETLALIPEVRNKLAGMVKDTDSLLSRKSAIESAFTDASKARIVNKEGLSAQSIVGQMYSSPQYASRFLKQYSNDKDAMKAIRSFMLDDIIKSNEPLKLLSDRAKGNIYDEVFGSAYKQTIADLAVISDRITKDPSAVVANIKGLDADMLTQLTGTKPERFVSLFYTNPVVSKPVAIMTVLNRFINKKAGDIAEKKMMDLLLDKEAGVRMLSAIKKSLSSKNGIELSKYSDWAKDRGYDFVQMLKQDVRGGALRSHGGMNEEEIDKSWLDEE